MARSKRQTYDELFKLEVLRDYYSSGMSKSFTSKKWGLSNHTVLLRWIKRYPLDSSLLSLPAKTLISYQQAHTGKSREEVLEQEILNLQKALEMEKLRSRGFEKLLELTEKEEGISILKKAGAKQ